MYLFNIKGNFKEWDLCININPMYNGILKERTLSIFLLHRFLNLVLSWTGLCWLHAPSQHPSSPSGLKPYDNSLIFLRSVFLVSLLTASPPDRLEATALTWITAEPVSCTEQTDSQIHSGRTVASAAHHQPAVWGAAAAAAITASTPSSSSSSHLTWQTPAWHRLLTPCCAPLTPLSPSPSPSWGREAECGKKGKNHRCLGTCPARCQPNAPAPTQRKCD